MFDIKDSSTELIVKEAMRRGIETVSLPEINPHIFLLEHDGRREYIYFTSTDLLGHVTFKIFLNKRLATFFLQRGGFTVPEELVTEDVVEAAALLKRHKQVVTKPLDSTWGKGVTPGITDSDRLESAFAHAREYNLTKGDQRVLCQQHVDGTEYRVLVIDQRHIFSVRRIPAHVTGDGSHTVGELIELHNQSAKHGRELSVTERTHELLARQNMTLDSVPAAAQKVSLRLVANAHGGGTVEDATELVGEPVRQRAIEIAKYFNTPIVGIDCITSNIASDLGYVIELNSTPDITLHHFPTEGQARDVAAAIVDMLFPETMRETSNQ